MGIRYCLALLLLALVSQIPCAAQTYTRDSTVIKELCAQILRYKKSWMEDDVETAITMTHPEMVEKMGGESQMRQSFLNGKEIRATYNMQYVGLDFVPPDSLLVSTESYQVAFPVVLTVQYKDGSTETDNRIMVAFGHIPSGRWYFLGVPLKEIDYIKTALQFIDSRLVIPK